MSRAKKDTYTPREVAAALNNAVLAVGSGPGIAGLSDERLRKIRLFTDAVTQALLQDCDEERMTPDELVYALVGAALFVHSLRVLGTATPFTPAFHNLAARLLEDVNDSEG